MNIDEFDYNLPEKYIAQTPAIPRDSCKLMVLKGNKIIHSKFSEIDRFLKKGDVLVLNDSKVFPARLIGKKPTKGKIEILLVWPDSDDFKWSNKWRIICKPGLKIGQEVVFKGLKGIIIKDLGFERIIQFNKKGKQLKDSIFSIGLAPTPPYIKKKCPKHYYQTVYAKNTGSIAGPTAGFHFTDRLINKLKKKGIIFKYITLHVGLGTFQPLKVKKVEDHTMDPELAFIDEKTKDFLKNAKTIISVGTTTTRTLESFKSGMLDLFIYPGYTFKRVDCLLTNFHLPKSTPLLMTCAFANKKLILKAYKEAIKHNYRFYSFGDAMLICSK